MRHGPDPPIPPPDRPRNWGGGRAGARAPRGPRPATPIEAPTPRPAGGVAPAPGPAEPRQRKPVLDRVPPTRRTHERRGREDAQPRPPPGAAPA